VLDQYLVWYPTLAKAGVMESCPETVFCLFVEVTITHHLEDGSGSPDPRSRKFLELGCPLFTR
jgi:hypothetical protein